MASVSLSSTSLDDRDINNPISGKKSVKAAATKASANLRSGSRSKRSSGSAAKTKELTKDSAGSSDQNKAPSLSPSDTVRIHCGKDVYDVNAHDLANCSARMDEELAQEPKRRVVKFNDNSAEAVYILTIYIATGMFPDPISFYALAELLVIGGVFRMERLTECLEWTLITLAEEGDPSIVMEGLMVIGQVQVSRAAEDRILDMAALLFIDLAKLGTFQSIQYRIFSLLLSRCHLSVHSELVAADIALLWLAGQDNLVLMVDGIFAKIRAALFTSSEKGRILERASDLAFPCEAIRSIDDSLRTESAFFCMKSNHVEAGYARCGVIYPRDDKTEDMPFSFPSETLCYKAMPRTSHKKKIHVGVDLSPAKSCHSEESCSESDRSTQEIIHNRR